MKNVNIQSNMHVNDPENPFYDAIECITGEVPPFNMAGVFNSIELSDNAFMALQEWGADNFIPWATGLSMIDCANLIVKSAIENGNILSKDMPKRYQRSRKKGEKLPKGVICVTRPGNWGNPFETAEEFGRILGLLLAMPRIDLILDRFASYDKDVRHMAWIAKNLNQLSGKSIACFCPLDAKCHGDFLLKFANGV